MFCLNEVDRTRSRARSLSAFVVRVLLIIALQFRIFFLLVAVLSAENLWARDDVVQELSVDENCVVDGRDPVGVPQRLEKFFIGQGKGVKVLSAPVICIHLADGPKRS